MVIKRTALDLGNSPSGKSGEFGPGFPKGGNKCGSSGLLIKGLMLTIFGILLIIWTPFSLIMEERLRMHRGLPPFEWWKNPPDLILLRAHVYNYTNAEEWLKGAAAKLHVEDVGPIIYKEFMTHKNISFNDNSTVSYIVNHTAVYVPELNSIDLEEFLIVPNYALLGIVTYLHDASFFTKLGANMLMRQLKSQVFVRISVRDFLWNFTDPISNIANGALPRLMPVNNIGMLSRVYDEFEDSVNMYIGTEHGDERFSLIEKYAGSEFLPNYKNCDDKVTNSTEGMTYRQFLTKQSVLKYWRKTICRVIPLTFQKEMSHTGFNAYKYTVPPYAYNRTFPAHKDCYKGFPTLLDGLSDVSNCYYGVPLAASFPHFLYGDDEIKDFVSGLRPNETLHESFVIAEPTSGIPLESIARSQSNMVIRKLSGFNKDVLRFSGLTLPMFWLEYHQIGIPTKVHVLIYVITVLIKPAQMVLVACLFLLGFIYVARFAKNLQKSYRSYVCEKSARSPENETFLKMERFPPEILSS